MREGWFKSFMYSTFIDISFFCILFIYLIRLIGLIISGGSCPGLVAPVNSYQESRTKNHSGGTDAARYGAFHLP